MNIPYDLTRVRTKAQLLDFLGIEAEAFDRVAAFDPIEVYEAEQSTSIYTLGRLPFFRHKINKRDPSKGVRIVWEAASPYDRDLKGTARRLNAFFSLLERRHPHPNAYGYVKGRNIRENATRHVGQRYILKCDVENFFGSLTTDRLGRLFRSYGVADGVSDLLADYLTIDGALPLGFPTSPILSNILCLGLDEQLSSLAPETGATYTRYADDLTFSGNAGVPELCDVSSILQAHGLRLAARKTRRTTIGQSHYVTGLSVSSKDAPHVPRKMKKRLRQELYYAQKYGLPDHLARVGVTDRTELQRAVNRIDGTVKYVAHHEPRLAGTVHALWRAVTEANDVRPSFAPKNRMETVVYVVGDETELVRGGSTILALCLCVTRDVEGLSIATAKVLDDHLADPLADGDRERIAKFGMHFADATEDLRKRYIETLQTFPFTAYVAMATLPDHAAYETTYLHLLTVLARRRLIASDGLTMFMRLEASAKISATKIKDVVDREHKRLVSENNRHPKIAITETVGKDSLEVALPDFVLGTLRKYLMMGPRNKVDRPERAELLFEHLRDKVVVLLDLDEDVEYSRRRPIRPWHEAVPVEGPT